MDILHLSIIAVLLCFNLPGSLGTKSQQQLLHTHPHSDCCWDGSEFLLNCSFTGLSTVPEDLSPTAVTADLSYNNIKTFLCTNGRNEDWMLKHLNLSNNLISELSIAAFRNVPLLETLNLNGNSISTLTLDIPTPARGSKAFGKVHRFLPALKVLSAERNRLGAVPAGLGLLRSLQTVHLSFNGIQQIDLNDFQNCSQLKNIYLQNNKITKIHPDAFKDLNKLQVVDLRENALTTILPQLLINLNIFQLEVDLSNNSWIFNCRLHAFKHFICFLSDSTRKTWSTSYNKPASSSKKPLLHLSSFHPNCSDSISFRTAVVPLGETSVLGCSAGTARGNRVSWWTPQGRISEESSLPHMALDKMNNLVIHNAEKTAEGLYMCIFNSTKKKYLIYNVEVKERVSASLVRKTRDTSSGFRAERREQDLALAVCLSVCVTFICAFGLGAWARPCLGRLWARVRPNKAPAPEHVYANQGFSDETLSRGHAASKLANTEHDMFIFYENSPTNRHTPPVESAPLYGNVMGDTVCTRSTEELPRQSNDEINKTAFSNTRTNSSDATYINVAQLSARTGYKNSNEPTPRELARQSPSLWEDSKHTNNEQLEQSRLPPTPRRLNASSHSVHAGPPRADLSYTGDAALPLPTAQPRSSARGSGDSKVSNSPGQLQSEAELGAPEGEGNVSHHEPLSTTKRMPGRQHCDGEPALYSNINTSSDVGDFILPSSSKRDTNIENFSAHQKPENSPHTEHSSKREFRNEQGNFADFFGDSSSDEGTPFTLSDCSSDCSSLEDFDLDQPGVSSNPPGPPSLLERADTDRSGNFSALPESLSIAAELRHIGRNEDKHNVYFGTTTDYGSVAITPEAASPGTAKCSDHVSASGSDTVSSSPNVPDVFDYFSKVTAEQNSISDSPYKQTTDFSNKSRSLKHSPIHVTDTQNTPEDTKLQLHQFPVQPQHLLRLSPPEQKGFTPEVSADQLTDGSSSESTCDKGDTALRWNTSTSSENDSFICTPIDTGLNEIVEKAPLPHASAAHNESLLPFLPENTAGKHSMVIAEKGESLPQGECVNTAKACENKTQRGFNEEEHNEHRELQDSSNCSFPDETQLSGVTTDSLYIKSSQPAFNTENFLLGLREENAHSSSSVPCSSFTRSVLRGSGSFPQMDTGNQNSTMIDAIELEGDTSLTALENNSTTAANLPNSDKKLSQKVHSSSGQGQFFVKKKRAFDGFANILQSRTDFES